MNQQKFDWNFYLIQKHIFDEKYLVENANEFFMMKFNFGIIESLLQTCFINACE